MNDRAFLLSNGRGDLSKNAVAILDPGETGAEVSSAVQVGPKSFEDGRFGPAGVAFSSSAGRSGLHRRGDCPHVIPGPAILFFFIAGSLLSTESLFVARWLDGSEVKLRAGLGWSQRHWRKLSLGGKLALEAAAFCVAVVLGFTSWLLIAN